MNTPTDTPTKLSRAQLAKLTGLRASTIKFYSESGLLPYDQAEEGLARRYDPRTAVERLRQIQTFKAQGMGIDAIKARMNGMNSEPSSQTPSRGHQ